MSETVKCASKYGPVAGPHEGAAEWCAVLVSQTTGKALHRIEPLCHPHARYEQQWSEAMGMAALVEIEPSKLS